jgi:sterol desaturase/sphingolipid hydroxylase (fatty acid hydroxylase superfamily)
MSIFNLGHSGFRQNLWLWAIMPLAFLQQLPAFLGIPLSLKSTDHEMHHLFPQCNFALNFSFWDKMLSSYKPIETLEALRQE